MTKRWMKIINIVMLGLILVINIGCVVTSPLLNMRPSSPVIVIDTPPNRLAISGQLSTKDYVYLQHYLYDMLNEDYYKHNYRYKSGLDVNLKANIKMKNEFNSNSNIKIR